MSLDPNRLAPMANAIRALSMDAVQAANSGHPGMPMGMADVATVLWSKYLKFDPSDPKWADRDRFVLSAGHGSMLIYSLLHLSGYAHPTMEEIANFRQLGSPCAGHPENFLLDGVECTTGPLGQGLAMAVGMAIAERHLNAEFGSDLVDHRTWVVAGDGCLMEGVNHEAIGIAGHLKLGRMIVLWDDNAITIDGSTDLSTSEDIRARYEATGWHVVSCDGHDPEAIQRAIDEAVADERPSLVACRTVIGKGAPNKQGTSATHGAALGDRHAHRHRQALAERTGGALDAVEQEVLWVPRTRAAELAEVRNVRDGRTLVTSKVQQAVDQHRAVTGREHEAVAVRPGRIGGIVLQIFGPEDGRGVGHPHRHAGMAAICRLDGIHRQGADGVGERSGVDGHSLP